MSVVLEYDYGTSVANMKNFSQQDFELLREWTKNLDPIKFVPKNLSDAQLLIFYNACELDPAKTRVCIEKYYLFRHNAPELFNNRILMSPEIKPSLEALEFSFLPEKSVDGYDIIFHRLHNTEPSKYNLEAGCKLLFMTVDACLHQRGPQPGYIFLFDMRGVKLGHLTRVSLSTLRKFFQFVQEALPVRMKAIHVMNTEPVLDKLLLVIRPFMDKKFFDMIRFHKKNEDLTSFYDTVIPRSALPPDYGGTLPDTRTLHQRCMQQLQLLEPYWKTEEEQRKACVQNKNGKSHSSFNNIEID